MLMSGKLVTRAPQYKLFREMQKKFWQKIHQMTKVLQKRIFLTKMTIKQWNSQKIRTVAKLRRNKEFYQAPRLRPIKQIYSQKSGS